MHRSSLIAALVLSSLSFTLHLAIVLEIDRLDVVKDINVLFDADSGTRLEAFSQGRHLGIKHPNLMPFVFLPVRAAAKLGAGIGLWPGPQDAARRALALLVVPAASAIETGGVFAVFSLLGFSTLPAILATLLSIVSFSSLVFGSIPESYGLSGLALAAVFLLALRSIEKNRPAPALLWVSIAFVVMGITISNLVIVALVQWTTEVFISRRFWVTTRRVLLVALVATAVTAVSSYLLEHALVDPASIGKGRWPPQEGTATTNPEATAPFAPGVLTRRLRNVFGAVGAQVEAHSGRTLREAALRYPTVLAATFAPGAVRTTDRWPPGGPDFTLEGTPGIFSGASPLGLILFLAILGGTFSLLACPSPGRPVAVASIAVLLFSLGLGFWGIEMILYSQHWHLAALILLAGIMRTPRVENMGTLVFAGITTAVAVQNALVLSWMRSVLSA